MGIDTFKYLTVIFSRKNEKDDLRTKKMIKMPAERDKRPEDIYKGRIPGDEYERMDEIVSVVRPVPPEEYEKRVVIKKVKTVTRESMPKIILEDELEPLKTIGPKVVGDIFDRISFLKERIKQTKDAIELRKQIHKSIMEEIDKDIEDKERILERLTDIDDIRDFKLDISMLRMEKRRESVRFWRDMFQLNSELRQLLEEYETEVKIANILKGG